MKREGRDWTQELSLSYFTGKKTETQRGGRRWKWEANSLLLAWALDLNTGLSDERRAIQCPLFGPLSSSQLFFIEILPSPAAPWEPGQARNNYNASKEQLPASCSAAGTVNWACPRVSSLPL